MFRFIATSLLLALATLGPLGCGGGTSVSSYQPKGNAAKAALTVALDAWKSGREKPGTLDSQKPAVEVQDSIWGSGRKLKDFQIGDEQPSSDGPTRFAVQLTFESEPTTEQAEYYVVGKDPLWVMRDKDYHRNFGQ